MLFFFNLVFFFLEVTCVKTLGKMHCLKIVYSN